MQYAFITWMKKFINVWVPLWDVHLQDKKKTTLRHLAALMYTKPDGHLLRSELALISNMARTIKNKEDKSRMMTEYNEILKAMEQLPDMSATDMREMILDLSWQISCISIIMIQRFSSRY